jgi:hypothetical protein
MWIRNRQVLLTIDIKSSENAMFKLSDVENRGHYISHTKNDMIHTVAIKFDFTSKLLLDCTCPFEIQSISLMGIAILKHLIPKVTTVDNNRIIFNFFNNDPVKYLMFMGNTIKI